MSIKVKIVLIKAYNSVRIIERYYGLIWYIYSIIIAEIHSINKDIVLQMAFKAINDTVGLDRIVLTLLVYNTLLQITKYNTLSLIII